MMESSIDCFETPAKMSAITPESSGKEILQRFRQMVAQKSAERILTSNGEGNADSSKKYDEIASNFAQELKNAAKSSILKDGEISIFKDSLSAEKPKLGPNIKLKTMMTKENGGLGDGALHSSVKTRFKHSLAQRRTALKSRNMNINSDLGRAGIKSTKKKSMLATTPLKSNSEVSKSSTSASTIFKSEASTEDTTEKPKPLSEKDEMSTVKEDMSSAGGISLELDDTVGSDVVDSMEGSASASASASETESKMHADANDGHSEGQERDASYMEEQGQHADAQLFHNRNESSAISVLETLEEVEVECESEPSPAKSGHSSEIDTEKSELISFVESCESVNSNSSSTGSAQEVGDVQKSPRSHAASESSALTPADSLQPFSVGSPSDAQKSPQSRAVSENSALTPADSIQTFSVGSSYQKSPVESQNSGSGITPAESIKTISIGGRSVNITTDPFKTSIFTPSPIRTEDFSISANDSGTEPSCSGQTVIPDVSIADGHHIFPSPSNMMLYASPTAQVKLGLSQDVLGASARGDLDELSRQLEAVRSEKKDSTPKMSPNTSQVQKLLQMYDEASAEETVTDQPIKRHHVASPASIALATGDSSGLSKAAAASLIERNKTLVKEVRFADQTCVEMSEKNMAMQREIQKLEKDSNELKGKNDSLHDTVVKVSEASARAEESRKEMEIKLEEERKRFELQLQAVSDSLEEEKVKNKMLSEKLDQKTSDVSTAQQNVASITAKYEAVRDEHKESKEELSSLRERLATIESTAELAAAAAAQKYREASYEMQQDIHGLQDEVDEYSNAIQLEREARQNVENELIELEDRYQKLACNQNELQIASPELHSVEKEVPSSPCRSEASKTSTVLAKTLKVEIERGHETTERIIESERIITVTQAKLRDTERDLKLARKEVSELRRLLKGSEENANRIVSTVNDDQSEISADTMSVKTDNVTNAELTKKLSSARSQCEEYKKELDSIITHIKGIQSDQVSSAQASNAESSNVLETVKELAQICTRVNVAAGDKVSKLEDRIRFLTQSMYQLHDICFEDESNVSGFTSSLEAMEEGTTSPTPVKENKTPMRVLYLKNNESLVSPNESEFSLAPPRERTPVKAARLRNELLVAEEQLISVKEENNQLTIALDEAKLQIESLTLNIRASNAASCETRELQREKSVLEQAVSGLRSRAVQLENTIASLQEDNAQLFEDAAERVDQLEEANDIIEDLKSESRQLQSLFEKSSEEEKRLLEENNELSKQLSAANDEIETLSGDVDRHLTTLRDIEAYRDNLEDKIKAISGENESQVDMIHDLQESLSQTNAQVTELKSSYMLCNEELAEVIESKTVLEAANNDLQSQICELDAKSRTVESISLECEELKNKLATTEDAYDSVHEEMVKMGSQIEVLCEANDEYEGKMINAQEERQAMKNELDSVSSELESTLSQLSKTKETLMDKERKLKEVMSKLESSSSQLSTVREALERKESELNTTKSHLEAVEERFEDFESEVESTNDAKNNELLSKDSELNRLKARVGDLQDTLAQNRKKHQEAVQNYEVNIGLLRTELKETEEQLQEYFVNHRIVKEKMEHLQESASIAGSEIESKDNAILKLRRKNESLNRKCTRMREYVRNLTSKCREWEDTMSEKENVTQGFQHKYEQAMARITELTFQLSSATTSVASSNCPDCNYLRNAIATESSVVSQLTNDLDKRDTKISTLRRRLLERSARNENLDSKM